MIRSGLYCTGLLAALLLFGCGGSDEDPIPETNCGNGVVDEAEGEECDNGEANSDIEADACRTNCREASCGDGVIDNREDCDDGAANSDTEANACRTTCDEAACGDGVLDDGEECDDGSANSDELPDACRRNCDNPVCGDGVADTGEECDDGDEIENNGCLNDCTSPALWTATDNAGGTGALATDVAIDSDDNVVIVGYTNVNNPSILVRKYNSGGTELWTKTVAGGQANAVAIDGSDNILVAGQVVSGSLLNAWVRKYNPQGNEIWTDTYAPAGGAAANGIAVDSAGNVYAGGGHSLGSGIDVWVQQYDSDGVQGWQLSLDEGASDEAQAVAVDPSGDVVFITQSETTTAVVSTAVMKYTSAGDWVWTVPYVFTSSLLSYLMDVESDGSGNPVISGELINTGSSVNDAWVMKRSSSDGSEMWSRTFDGPTGQIDGALAVGLDGSGNVLTTGAVDYNGSVRSAYMLIQKRSASGDVIWTWYYGGEGDWTLGLGVAADSGGNVVVAGIGGASTSPELVVRKYEP